MPLQSTKELPQDYYLSFFLPAGVHCRPVNYTYTQKMLPSRGAFRLSKNSLAPSGRGLRPQAVGERASRRHEGFG